MGLLPVSIQLETEPDSRPAAMMVTAGDQIVHAEIVAASSVEVPDLTDLMATHLKMAIQSSGAKPKRLRIYEPELVQELASKMEGELEDIEVFQGPIREVEKAWKAMALHLTGKPASHAVFASNWMAWGQPDAWVAAVFDAAGRLYRAQPWRVLDADHDLIEVELDGSVRLGVSIMGAAGFSHGLMITTEGKELLADLARMKKPGGRPRGQYVTLSLNEQSEIPDAGLREIESQGWPVAGDGAYPLLNVVHCRAGGLPRERAESFLRVLEAVCTLFEDTAATEGFLAGAPWQSEDGSLRMSLAGVAPP